MLIEILFHPFLWLLPLLINSQLARQVYVAVDFNGAPRPVGQVDFAGLHRYCIWWHRLHLTHLPRLSMLQLQTLLLPFQKPALILW